MIAIQTEDFDVCALQKQLCYGRVDIGAVVSFTGLVRDFGEAEEVSAMTLEHYPGMTEKALENILKQAKNRWQILDAIIIHRVGYLSAGDNIVLVMVASSHRLDAFQASMFLMDYLKTQAPFWKKEHLSNGDIWVSAKESDTAAATRWLE